MSNPHLILIFYLWIFPLCLDLEWVNFTPMVIWKKFTTSQSIRTEGRVVRQKVKSFSYYLIFLLLFSKIFNFTDKLIFSTNKAKGNEFPSQFWQEKFISETWNLQSLLSIHSKVSFFYLGQLCYFTCSMANWAHLWPQNGERVGENAVQFGVLNNSLRHNLMDKILK
jgi:hypothetical protein